MLDHFNRELLDVSPLGYYEYLLSEGALMEWRNDFLSTDPNKYSADLHGLEVSEKQEERKYFRWQPEVDNFVEVEESFAFLLKQKLSSTEAYAMAELNSKAFTSSSFEKERLIRSTNRQLAKMVKTASTENTLKQYPAILNSLERLVEIIKSTYTDYLNESEKAIPPSFTFLGGKSDRSKQSFKELFYSLTSNVSFEFLDRDTDWQVFKKVFSGKEIRQRLIWTGSLGSLRMLILKMIELGKIKDEKNMHWKIASKCFLHFDEKLSEVVPVKPSKLSNGDRTKTNKNDERNRLISKLVEDLIIA